MPARFTDSVVAAVRQRYEDTDQLVASIAAEFGGGVRTIGHWIAAYGWRKRSLRTRALTPLRATAPSRWSARASTTCAR